ncbi:MAG: glycine oxidase ThiO [Brevibacterium yomogidense]
MRAVEPSHPDAPRSDVVIVGAGVIGLATAWRLRERGLSVSIVDPDPGGAASRAAAGMIAPASEVQYQQHALYPLMRKAASNYPDFVAGVQAASGHDVGYRRTETLVCAGTPADRQGLAELREHQNAHGMEVDALTVREARALEPALSPRLAGAFRAVGDHQVDPRRLVAGLIAALSSREHRAHATLVTQAAVRLSDDGGGVELADGSRIAARHTILATGLGSDLFAGLPASPAAVLRPVHGDILRARLPDGAAPLLERTIRGVVNGVPVYLVPRADGEIVIGATSREDDLAGASAGGVYRLLRDAQTLVPAVCDLELVEVMARARPGTPDDVPLLGRLRDGDGAEAPGLILATGGFRHGVLLAPLLADAAAALVTGDSRGPDLTGVLRTTDPYRFHPTD